MKLKGATEPNLSLYLSCSPASSGMVNVEVVWFVSTIVHIVYTCKHIVGLRSTHLQMYDLQRNQPIAKHY